MRTVIFVLMLMLGMGDAAWCMGYFEQSKKIEELERNINIFNQGITRQIDSLFLEVAELKDYSMQLKQERDREKNFNRYIWDKLHRASSILPETATVAIGEKKYSMVACQGALMAVSFEDIKSKASGSELTLKFVNFYSVTNTNVSLEVEYSKENLDYDEKLSSEEISSKMANNEKYKRQKRESLRDTLPGTATYVKIFLPEYKAEEIKYLSVSIKAGGMAYKQGQER